MPPRITALKAWRDVVCLCLCQSWALPHTAWRRPPYGRNAKVCLYLCPCRAKQALQHLCRQPVGHIALPPAATLPAKPTANHAGNVAE